MEAWLNEDQGQTGRYGIMARQPKLLLAQDNYSKEREHLFRRELESLLLDIVSELRSISNGVNPVSSLNSKRGGYLPPMGTTVL